MDILYLVWSNHFLFFAQYPAAGLNTQEHNAVATCCRGTTAPGTAHKAPNSTLPFMSRFLCIDHKQIWIICMSTCRLLDSKPAFRSSLCHLDYSKLCCKSWTISLIPQPGPSCYFSGTHAQLRVGSSKVSESQLVSEWLAAFSFGVPGAFSARREKWFSSSLQN